MSDKLYNTMLNRPAKFTGEVQYPKTGITGIGDDALRSIVVALGLEEQQPGDGAGAIGSAAGLFGVGGLGKLLKFFPNKIKADIPAKSDIKLPPEFTPMPDTGTMNDLARGEIDKIVDLSKPRPHLEKPNTASFTSYVSPPPVDESAADKIFRIMQERRDRRDVGLIDPRVRK